jgi:uracil-DNA glycosylase
MLKKDFEKNLFLEYSKKNMIKGVKKSWKKFIEKEMEKEYFDNIINKIKKDQGCKKLIFPFPDKVFETLKYTRKSNLKCVIIGQDPYINYQVIENKVVPQAMGMSFSVPKSVKVPPSLKNIYKELDESIDTFNIPNHGDLSRWVKEENIILLNAALTVVEGKSNSHKKIWANFTDNLIKYISDKCDNIVFLLWGNFAKSKALLIDINKHKIISSVHPSPLSSRYNCKGTSMSFFGHNQFNNVNNYLENMNISRIKWDV